MDLAMCAIRICTVANLLAMHPRRVHHTQSELTFLEGAL